jgi:acetyl-CoA carboxylase carboxyltransferase component
MNAVMGPDAAYNAFYYTKLQAMPEDERKIENEKLRCEYREDIDIARLASELVIDAIVAPERLRDELVARFAAIAERPHDTPPPKRRSVTPM